MLQRHFRVSLLGGLVLLLLGALNLAALPASPRSGAAMAARGAQADQSKASSSGVELSDALLPGNDSIKFDIKWDDGTPLKLKPQEEVAFLFVNAIYMLEGAACNLNLNRYCSIPELAKGIKTDFGMRGLKRDPAQDTNYRYTFTSTGENSLQVAAIPQRPGLGGWLIVREPKALIRYYNPNGAATTKDKTISRDSSALGGGFERR